MRKLAKIPPHLGALGLLFSCFSATAAAQEDLLSYFPSSPSNESSGDASWSELVLRPPNEDQQQLLRELTAEESEFGASVTSVDGTVSGDDVERVLRGESDQPIAAFSIKLNPDLSREEAIEALAHHGLLVTETADEAGVVSGAQVISERPIEVWTPEYEAATRDALETLRSDPSFLSVGPELSVGEMQEVRTALSIGPMPFGDDDAIAMEYAALGDAVPDWGLTNIGAPTVWNDPLARQGKAVGVLDMGFSIHDDLPLWDLPANVGAADHGNHVAGILCAKHDEKGTSGVLPTCLVVPRAPDFSRQPDLYGIKPDSMAAVLNAFSEIVENRDEIKAVNISLGYNWRKRFDLTLLDDDRKRDIASLAAQMASVYRTASERGIFIVSAAGNDSWGLDPKLNAAWASPLNYASLAFCQAEGLCNGVVVEAHDKKDQHADFSNVGGTLSCPGVDVLSTVAYDPSQEVSLLSYAFMSGTSMASPYCAGGLVLLSMVRPEYQVVELITCARASGRSTGDFSAPALDLGAALESCPTR